MAVSPDGKSLLIDLDMDEDSNRENWDGPPPAIWLIDLNSDKASRLTEKDFFAWDPYWVDDTEFVLSSQAPKEKTPSLYRGSIQRKDYKPLTKDARTASVSR